MLVAKGLLSNAKYMNIKQLIHYTIISRLLYFKCHIICIKSFCQHKFTYFLYIIIIFITKQKHIWK